jgi:hypothetical protein
VYGSLVRGIEAEKKTRMIMMMMRMRWESGKGDKMTRNKKKNKKQ